ncbi:23S rRNA (guanosine(2251)-2'-O)-methyltransferase RlmB [Desulfofundulus thermobenzoicus]|uniref:23S rRNA (Guanosine(2251)-2'-O)-methyltransferase RlmB n=1 Tax=Desulfofundulus thermobenzoicus TaxID=29376 RepID=A0A6N7IR20_9FIRM|nr:23S rRNA (guanosine(2251)-2'-O)-methyltransferase RlmB [Desulfofundulus thermobenzoicus]MQL51967.1 23S rRNA (guanosine(2251)-2'-O)-methyltransferase RlmB [Desulfofundulus thermobenzoicus]HHW43735.1 23S rRNA (guanosine(2251)-2'-O)-methyltransferase RlmB [Desulfotomaculum sp.]
MTASADNAIAGRHAVKEALLAGRAVNKILVARGATNLQEIIHLARERRIPVQQVERVYLDRLVPQVPHQGVAALAAPREYLSVEEILALAAGEDPFLILLDEITDPHNLGAILRTADAAGVHGVIIPRRRAAALTPAVVKASAGAVEHVPVARVANLARTIARLQERGLWVVGADPAAPQIYWDARLDGPIALVIGGEDRGLGRLVREKCDFLVSLPMAGRVGSLNASVAAALLAYEVVRQRGRAHE